LIPSCVVPTPRYTFGPIRRLPLQRNKNLFRTSVTAAQFSPNGRWVVTASKDGAARIWDASTGKPIGKPMKHGRQIVSAQFSPDGQRVVTASSDKTARVWDAVFHFAPSGDAGDQFGVPSYSIRDAVARVAPYGALGGGTSCGAEKAFTILSKSVKRRSTL
jgi:hypothetical protein